MKRNVFRALLLVLLCALLALPASADVLWEPIIGNSGSDFYSQHAAECDTVARTYSVPEDSSATLYRSPEDGTVVAELNAGDQIYIGESLTWNGELWAVGYLLGNGSDELQGWVRLGRLQLNYDNAAFQVEYGDTFTSYEGQLDDYTVQDCIYGWTYPGSGVVDGTLDEIDPDYGVLTCRKVYTDPDGGQWGYVGYYMGSFGWVYLDDPENPDAPVFPQQAENTVTETGPETAPETVSDSSVGAQVSLAAVLIVLVVAVTAALLLWMRRRKK